MAPYRNQRRYIQNYRKNWEHMKEFKDWLKPYPRDSTKAYCKVCNIVITAHLCDLRKHGAAKKHKNGILLLKSLNDMKAEEYSDTKVDNEENEQSEMDNEDEDSGSNEKWKPEAVESLLRHLKSYWKDYTGDTKKKKEVWQLIADAMESEGFSYSGAECGRKFRNIKLRYLNILEKSLLGEQLSSHRIQYFNDIHELLSKDPATVMYLEQRKLTAKEGTGLEDFSIYIQNNSACDISSENIDQSGDPDWTEDATNLLLDLLLEFKDVFTGKEEDSQIPIWQSISHHMTLENHSVSEDQCRQKWENMVKLFNNIQSVAEKTGSVPQWPYFTRVFNILNLVRIPSDEDFEKSSVVQSPKSPGRPRKRKLVEVQGSDSDGSDEGEIKEVPRKRRNGEHAVIRRIQRLSENADLWGRLNAIESRIDSLSEQQELQQNTNTLLTQILSELSILSSNISSKTFHNFSREGITLVVPQTEEQ